MFILITKYPHLGVITYVSAAPPRTPQIWNTWDWNNLKSAQKSRKKIHRQFKFNFLPWNISGPHLNWTVVWTYVSQCTDQMLCMGDPTWLVCTKERCYKLMYASYSYSCGSGLESCTCSWYTGHQSADFRLSIWRTSAGVAVLPVSCARNTFLNICGKS